MDPVGLSRLVGLLLEDGELKLRGGGGRLIRAPRSSVPVREDEEVRRKERRSIRDPDSGSFPEPRSLTSFIPEVTWSLKDPVSGREPLRNRERWVLSFSPPRSRDGDL